MFSLEALHNLDLDLGSRVFDYLEVDDLLNLEKSIDQKSGSLVNQYFGNYGSLQCGFENSHCRGCCQCQEDFESNALHLMRFFLWIGEETDGEARCYWKGHVPNTSSGILLTGEIQKAILVNNESMAMLRNLLTKESKLRRVVSDMSIPELPAILKDITKSLSIRVLSTYPRQALVMAATPSSQHLKIHWDDTTYNRYWEVLVGDTTTDGGSTGKTGMACLHLWFILDPKKEATLSHIRMDKCTGK